MGGLARAIRRVLARGWEVDVEEEGGAEGGGDDPSLGRAGGGAFLVRLEPYWGVEEGGGGGGAMALAHVCCGAGAMVQVSTKSETSNPGTEI